MTPHEFIAKWRKGGDEFRDAQPFFEDLCRLVGHPTPREADPEHTWFTYEYGASKTSGGEGWADVWKKGFFGWEAKGTHKSLERAYQQLKMYADALQNPPLLVVSDLQTIVIHTNFTNTIKREIRFTVEELVDFDKRQILEAVFKNPEALRPGITRADITQKAAEKFATLADILRGRGHDTRTVAHFLIGSSAWLWIAGFALASATGCVKHPDNGNIAGQSVASTNADASAEVGRAQTIAGNWVYEGTHRCASNDMARLTIDEVSGHTARGAWYSFNTEREWEGDVIATMRGDRWFLRFCYAKDKKMGQYTCPAFATEQVYVQRRGKDLVWYRAQDDTQIEPGQGTPLENGCDRAQREAATRPAPPVASILPGDKDATRPFVGEWAYVQACGARHSATLRIERDSESRVRGRWDDGTLASGSQGEFIGEARGDRLHLRFCRAYANNDADACPRFGAEQAYVARVGDRLMWYQQDGESRYSEYLSLRFIPPGYEPLQENDCGQAK